uniref:Cilia- and flagella-associated protein HOATZ n=1 Tax=Naja naja TaxID=35670 RepID=A0A8C6Y1B8_NAJNA
METQRPGSPSPSAMASLPPAPAPSPAAAPLAFAGSSEQDVALAKSFWNSVTLQPPLESRLGARGGSLCNGASCPRRSSAGSLQRLAPLFSGDGEGRKREGGRRRRKEGRNIGRDLGGLLVQPTAQRRESYAIPGKWLSNLLFPGIALLLLLGLRSVCTQLPLLVWRSSFCSVTPSVSTPHPPGISP